jgi:hypothetical protein
MACVAQLAFAQGPNDPQSDVQWRVWQPDPAIIAPLEMAFAETPAMVKDYDKYFYFHRQSMSFVEALTDLRECDARARGIWQGKTARGEAPGRTAYGLVGDLANALIFVPAQDRANLRRCMSFKGYARYGVPKALWESFNLQHIETATPEREIQMSLARQALVASGPQPASRALGL